MRKKISIALAAWFVMGSVFAAPVAAPVAEAASESVKLKSTAETYASQGEKLLNEGKYEEAGEAFRKAAEETNNDELWAMCGLSYIKAENYKKALDPCKKAVKLKPNEGLYNFYYGFSLWCYAGVVRAGKPLSSFSGTDEMDRGDQYVKRAAELLPNDVTVQMTAGAIAEKYANYLTSIGGYRSYIDEEYQRAYQHFRRAVEIDPSKTENVERLNRFVNTHSEYGFQPYNQALQPAQPAGNTTQPSAGGQQETGYGVNFTILESGAVEFVPRRGVAVTDLLIHEGVPYYVFIKPEKCNAWPGKYAYGRIYVNEETGDIGCSMLNTFDYDAQNNVFQFYWLSSEDPSASGHCMQLQVKDKNTIHVTLLTGPLTRPPIFTHLRWDIYNDDDYNRVAEITKMLRTDPQSIAIPQNCRALAAADDLTFYYKPYSDSPDVNGCQWVARYFDYEDKRYKDCVLFGLWNHYPEIKVEAAMCFLSVNGNVGELAEDYEIEVYSDPNGL